MKWEEKAEWLQENGYPLAIYALGTEEGPSMRWAADIGGEGRRYGETIGESVEKVYVWVEGPNNKTSLDDYETEPIDYTGCHPVIAKALKHGFGIKCSVDSSYDHMIIVGYVADAAYPYKTSGTGNYGKAEPIKKKKTEVRVKGPVEVMQWLVGNDYEFHADGRIFKGKSFFNPELWSLCGKPAPEGWQFPELTEDVEIVD